MSSPVVHLEITSQDGAKLQSFYTDLFGWKLDANNPMNYGVGMLNESVGIGVGPAQDGPGAAVFYIGVDSAEDALGKAESLGGKRIMGPMEVPNGPTIGLFADPEGHTVGVFQAPA
jgi:predicted enzyme related to lactoylglutathione lyase